MDGWELLSEKEYFDFHFNFHGALHHPRRMELA